MLNNDITLRKLEIFLSYMESMNISKTAELMNISSVSVHRALHSLEDNLRCPLFTHNGRNLYPLPGAWVMQKEAREVINALERCIYLTRKASGYHSQVLRLGLLYSLVLKTAPQIVQGLKKRCPELTIEFIMNSNKKLLEALNEEKIDAVLISTPDDYNAQLFETWTIFSDSIYLAVPVTEADSLSTPVDLRHLQNKKFIALSEGFATWRGFQEAFLIAGFTPDITVRVHDIFSLMSMVNAGMGYTLIPGRMRGLFSNGIRLLPLQEPYRMEQEISLVFPRSQENQPGLLSLLAECRMYARQLMMEKSETEKTP
ncbi:LysR family transcriptional regulator [Klebsiella grimontii]|uniref:LysR family transcriptional regulator n=1 Tax=Klebsiella TaxID=570 RepID=UPI0011E439FD|nr:MULTISPECIES: LysR family transcriptional regulator [Klebsiella]MBX4672566.1 LysR family transcriptional regulator [Klebsiella sp. CVUAS 5466.2]MBZ7408750.1 LysR family transcriptional regulator [Klebsiella grimontii]TYG03902.1 LysR family transcriptional regulator [Klebsiella grimontii]WDQ12336.1 LysR family transcriptional regulator [Klebsiella grimontii]